MKKQISLLCALSLLASLVACGGDGGSGSDTTTSPTGTTEPAETTVSDAEKYGYVAPDIPEWLDYEGREFGIAYPNWSAYRTYYFADEEIGETVNDACCKRMSYVEEKLNIDIVPYNFGDGLETAKLVNQTVMAGLDEYSIFLTHNYIGCIAILTSGSIMNWHDIPTIDLEKPYYNKAIRENFEYDGVLPFLSSDFILPDLNAIFFNRDMVEDYELEDPYEFVTSGNWTIDTMAELSKKVTKDLNGDNVMNADDQYGFSGELGWQIVSAITGGGQRLVEKNGDKYHVALGNESAVNLVEKLRNFMFDSANAYMWEYSTTTDPNGGGTPPVNFADGKSLFYQAPLSYFEFMRGSEVEYGILPYPKYDESQKDYETLNWAGYMVALKTISDPGLVGYVVELLSSESCRTVLPAFYDVLLGAKIARDEVAVEVLDMMFKNSICDMGIISQTFSLGSKLLARDMAGHASIVASNITSYENNLQKYIDGCVGLK